MRTSSGICVMQHPSSGMSVITSVSITKKQGWSSIRTGIIRKKPIKRICGINSSPFHSWFLISGKHSKSFLPEIPFRYFTIAVMDNFGGADTKQCTWSPSPHSNRWTVKPLSSAISCTSSCRYASTSAFNIFRRYIEHQSKAY